MTDEQKQNGVQIPINANNIEDSTTYTFTVTPTNDRYASSWVDNVPTFGGKGEPITFDSVLVVGQSYDFYVGASDGTTNETITEMVYVALEVTTTPE